MTGAYWRGNDWGKGAACLRGVEPTQSSLYMNRLYRQNPSGQSDLCKVERVYLPLLTGVGAKIGGLMFCKKTSDLEYPLQVLKLHQPGASPADGSLDCDKYSTPP